MVLEGNEVWQNEGEECLVIRTNGRDEKINKGTITNLKSLIGGKAQAAGISKYKVYIDNEKVNPGDIDNYDVDDIKVVEIKTYDKVAVSVF